MYLKLDIDGADGKALHPYPWIPPTGNVMYCMPQEGTEAYLYFPEAEEESAYAVSEIHNSRCPVFADAQSRGLVTEHGKKMQLYADVLGFAGGKEETVQECRMGEDGIHFSAGKGKLQVTGSGQITFRAPEISLDAVQKIGQYKMESMAKEKAGMYGAEVMTLTVSGGLGLIPVGGTVVTLPQLAGAFQLVAGIVTSQNLLFQIEEVLMFCTSGKEMGAPTGNGMHDSARELTEMASTQFAFYGLMNPYTYQRPKITLLPNETGLTVPGGTRVAVVPNGTAPALNPPYLPGQYTEYPAAVQGWAQQALPGGGSGIESGNSSIHYGELDSLGRATGVDATITVDMVGTGTPAKSSIKPAGFGGQKAGHARGHLLGNQLGGAGDDPRNLTTLFQNPVNHPVMSSVEGSVRKAVEAGEVVQYSVKPIYEGNTLIPSGVTIKAEGDKGFYIYQTILNRK